MGFLSLGFGLDWIAGVLLLGWIARVAVKTVEWLWWKPKRLERLLREQGIKGNPYRLLYGDLKDNVRLLKEARSKPMPISHDIVPRTSPFYWHVTKNYGKISVAWLGPSPRVIITDPDLFKEILSNKFGHFEKPDITPIGKFLATGLANCKGEEWARHRRIINPAFHLEKIKHMLPAFSTCCNELIERWESLIGSKGSVELDVWPELQNFTGDVISRAAFGSSYGEGRRIFQLQAEQAELFIKAVHRVYIPGYRSSIHAQSILSSRDDGGAHRTSLSSLANVPTCRFLPTRENKRREEIDKEVCALLIGIIKKREKAMKTGTHNDDLLGVLMESNFKHLEENGNHKMLGMTIDDVIAECKLFYFAGQETTAVLLTWTMIMLSMNPDWQERGREEVLQVFGKNKPEFDGLNRLKIVTMILYEVLRLYPPATFIHRSTYKQIKLGDFTFSRGIQFFLPILFLHHDPNYWGEDVNDFKPERFAQGVSKASKSQMVFFPFGGGPRICIGQNFSMMEAKLGLAMILQHFSFKLSPSYAHAPCTVITLQPQHGAPLVLHKF